MSEFKIVDLAVQKRGTSTLHLLYNKTELDSDIATNKSLLGEMGTKKTTVH